mgnify:CR=1 FL=1
MAWGWSILSLSRRGIEIEIEIEMGIEIEIEIKMRSVRGIEKLRNTSKFEQREFELDTCT